MFSDIPVFCLDSKLPTTLNFELVTGGYFTKFNTGRLRPEVQPLTLLYTILAEKVPFYIPCIEKRYPFHIPTLGSLVLNFM